MAEHKDARMPTQGQAAWQEPCYGARSPAGSTDASTPRCVGAASACRCRPAERQAPPQSSDSAAFTARFLELRQAPAQAQSATALRRSRPAQVTGGQKPIHGQNGTLGGSSGGGMCRAGIVRLRARW
jgi:hypothetical protein